MQLISMRTLENKVLQSRNTLNHRTYLLTSVGALALGSVVGGAGGEVRNVLAIGTVATGAVCLCTSLRMCVCRLCAGKERNY